MLEKYKGDAPDNVLTPQEVKEKKPFYKDWKFWVFSALITLFGFCSVYGFVLGTRYVHAVQEAAHVIADAQGSPNQAVQKKKFNAVADDPNRVSVVDLGSLYWWKNTSYGFYAKAPDNIYPVPNNNVMGKIFCERYETVLPNVVWNNQSGYRIALNQRSVDDTFPKGYFLVNDGDYYNLNASDFKSAITGVMLYYYNDGTGTNVYDDAYSQGSSEGYAGGYEEGYDDGYQALAGSQTINVTFDENFPKLNDIHYSWSVDGSVVDSGTINVRPNVQIPVKTFTRPGGYTHTAELNLWSENDEPLVIAYGRHEGLVIGGQQTYIYDTYNKTNSYEFGENNRYVWYVPTYWPNALFYIYSYGTWNQGYANDCYFEFDPEHNDRSKVGAYADGYQDGYHDATESGDAYDAGKEAGYEQGYQTGVTDGKNQGYAEATGGTKALAYMFVTAFQQPFDQLYRFLNFNLLGINLLALFSALVTLSLGIYVLKKVL